MEAELYSDIFEYVRRAKLPEKYTSTKSNFVSLAQKFSLNARMCLIRDGKIVVKDEELEGKESNSNLWVIRSQVC